MSKLGKLFFFAGKMGAGKSTLSKIIAAKHNALLISEDDWLAAHYPHQITTFDDYISYSNQIKPFVKSHVQAVLKTGTNVVMDFPANTVKQRGWFLSICEGLACEHELIYLNLSDEQCLAHIQQRRSEHPERAHFDTEAVFHHVTQYFEAPDESEGVTIVLADA